MSTDLKKGDKVLIDGWSDEAEERHKCHWSLIGNGEVSGAASVGEDKLGTFILPENQQSKEGWLPSLFKLKKV